MSAQTIRLYRVAILCVPILFASSVPVGGSELCVLSGFYVCCDPSCDTFIWPSRSGYSTEGSPSCGTSGVFAISSSDTDPNQNVGPLESGLLYLWALGGDLGFSGTTAEFSGDFAIAAFDTLHSGVSWDPNTQIANVTGCLFGPTLVARMHVSEVVGVQVDSWGRIKSLWRRYDPAPPGQVTSGDVR